MVADVSRAAAVSPTALHIFDVRAGRHAPVTRRSRAGHAPVTHRSRAGHAGAMNEAVHVSAAAGRAPSVKRSLFGHAVVKRWPFVGHAVAVRWSCWKLRKDAVSSIVFRLRIVAR